MNTSAALLNMSFSAGHWEVPIPRLTSRSSSLKSDQTSSLKRDKPLVFQVGLKPLFSICSHFLKNFPTSGSNEIGRMGEGLHLSTVCLGNLANSNVHGDLQSYAQLYRTNWNPWGAFCGLQTTGGLSFSLLPFDFCLQSSFFSSLPSPQSSSWLHTSCR